MHAAASVAEIAQAVATGKVSAAQVIATTLRRIGERDKTLNAFMAVTGERALARARAVDAERAAGRPLGVLAGVPFAAKNLFDVAGLATLAGSKINRDRPPAAADATLVKRLESAGGVLVGALNMGEYAYDFTGENAHFGPSRNPHDVSRMRRFLGGLRWCGGRRPRSAGPWFRHQRVDPCAVLVLRSLRPQTDVRPPVARGNLPLCGEPRPRGASCTLRARPGAGL
jgi:Amidase